MSPCCFEVCLYLMRDSQFLSREPCRPFSQTLMFDCDLHAFLTHGLALSGARTGQAVIAARKHSASAVSSADASFVMHCVGIDYIIGPRQSSACLQRLETGIRDDVSSVQGVRNRMTAGKVNAHTSCHRTEGGLIRQSAVVEVLPARRAAGHLHA